MLPERGCYHRSLDGNAEHADSLHQGNLGMLSACAMKMKPRARPVGMVSQDGILMFSRWPKDPHVLPERGCYHRSLVGIAEHADSLHRGNLGMPSACAMKMNASSSSNGYGITGWHPRAL